jgi:hypothetical protein
MAVEQNEQTGRSIYRSDELLSVDHYRRFCSAATTARAEWGVKWESKSAARIVGSPSAELQLNALIKETAK